MTFDEHAELTKDQIQKAAAVTVIAQNGVRVQFGDLFKDRKTIVIFIRHFWFVNAQPLLPHRICLTLTVSKPQVCQLPGLHVLHLAKREPRVIETRWH